MEKRLYSVEQEINAIHNNNLYTKIVLLEAVVHYLFIALDDEVQFCISEDIELSEASIEALQKAEAAGVGTSEALQKINEAKE